MIKIGVIGLGYVGLPVSVLFSKKYKVVGYDNNPERISELNQYKDFTNEVEREELKRGRASNKENVWKEHPMFDPPIQKYNYNKLCITKCDFRFIK